MPRHSAFRLSRFPDLHHLEVVCASYSGRAFPRHMHEQYVVGVITGGAERLSTRGTDWVAPSGSLVLLNPGQAHSNCDADDRGYAYRIFYIPEKLMHDLAVSSGEESPTFDLPVLQAPSTARRLRSLHAELQEQGTNAGTTEKLAVLLGDLFVSSGRCAPVEATDRLNDPVKRVRKLLADLDQPAHSLHQLAHVAGASPFQLLRAFRSRYGLTPHEYRLQLRLAAAKAMLRSGETAASVAASTGFADQSHLTRALKASHDVTPRAYSDAAKSSKTRRR